MWNHKADDGKKTLQEYGLTLRPKTVKVEKHKKDYADLVERLNGYLKQKEDA
jgi:hypothetical protein